MARFTLPRDLYHGKGALEALKTLDGTRAMVCVGGGSMKKFGFLDKVVAYLKEAGMEVELFEGIEPDPSVDTVMRGAEAMQKFQPDWIVAIGGGSPIDAANAMYLPKVIAYNAKDETAKKRYAEIADYMNLGGANEDEKVANLIAYLRGMNDALNIPRCIKHYGADSYYAQQGFVPEEVFLERLPEIAKNAVADACTGSNPRAIDAQQMEKLLKCCYYDTEVDF